MFLKKKTKRPDNPPRGVAQGDDADRARPGSFTSSVRALCLMLLLFLCCVALVLALGALAAWLLPSWTDIPVRIALVALAFWLMGKLIDFVFGPETFPRDP